MMSNRDDYFNLRKILIGQNIDTARSVLNSLKLSNRLTSKDGNYYVVTRDFNIQRFNLDVVDDIVSEITFG